MNAHKRSFVAVLIAGFVTQILAYTVPWWSFILILGLVYLVVDAALEALAERRAAR